MAYPPYVGNYSFLWVSYPPRSSVNAALHVDWAAGELPKAVHCNCVGEDLISFSILSNRDKNPSLCVTYLKLICGSRCMGRRVCVGDTRDMGCSTRKRMSCILMVKLQRIYFLLQFCGCFVLAVLSSISCKEKL